MRFLGVLSGTSADGIDLGLVNFARGVVLEAFATLPFPAPLQRQLQELPGQTATLPQLSQLQQQLNLAFANAIKQFLHDKPEPLAIGFHGQTLWHAPEHRCSWQLGDAAAIATTTGLPVISHFRQSDLALGGQGAPLAPAFHAELMKDESTPWAIVNIGGISNISLKTKAGTLLGWDSGPGNGILDALAQKHFGQPYDPDGVLAAQGQVNEHLLAKLLKHPYFHTAPPKSTGREQFSLSWFEHMQPTLLAPHDQLATATALTAATIARDLTPFQPEQVHICGGGAKNGHLMAQISHFYTKFSGQKNSIVKKWGRPLSEDRGQRAEDRGQRAEDRGQRAEDRKGVHIPADALEAALFAWLAYKRWHNQPVDYTTITGAERAGVYGTCFYPA